MMQNLVPACLLLSILAACGAPTPAPPGTDPNTLMAGNPNAFPSNANSVVANPNVTTMAAPPDGNNLLPLQIHPAGNATLCLTPAPFNAVQVQPCAPVGSQVWSFNGGPVVNANTCLGPAANGGNVHFTVSSAVDVQPCASNAVNQQWTFANGQFSLGGGNICLQLNTTGSGATMQSCNATVAGQNWTLSPNFTISAAGYLNKCVSVQGGVASVGALIEIDDCTQSPAQQWSYSGNNLTLGGLCLDVTSTVNGAQLSLGPCTDVNASWSLQGGALALTGQGICADLWNGTITNGNKIAVYTCVAGDKNQVWVLGQP